MSRNIITYCQLKPLTKLFLTRWTYIAPFKNDGKIQKHTMTNCLTLYTNYIGSI